MRLDRAQNRRCSLQQQNDSKYNRPRPKRAPRSARGGKRRNEIGIAGPPTAPPPFQLPWSLGSGRYFEHASSAQPSFSVGRGGPAICSHNEAAAAAVTGSGMSPLTTNPSRTYASTCAAIADALTPATYRANALRWVARLGCSSDGTASPAPSCAGVTLPGAPLSCWVGLAPMKCEASWLSRRWLGVAPRVRRMHMALPSYARVVCARSRVVCAFETGTAPRPLLETCTPAQQSTEDESTSSACSSRR